MTNAQGDFVWYELATPDSAAAAAFYAEVVGWTAGLFWDVMADYHVLSAGGTGIAGVRTASPGMGAGWTAYIGVDDVDAAVAEIVAAGGAVRMAPTDLPEVGRFAMVTDPQGVAFYVMRGASQERSDSFHPTAEGRCGWNELVTSDPAGATAFYTARFGWTKGGAMNMGEMGDYQFIEHGGAVIGAVRQRTGDLPPGWNHYFRVPDIDAAAARIGAAGGTIVQGPMAVPGDDHIVIGTDPQGVAFALVGVRR